MNKKEWHWMSDLKQTNKKTMDNTSIKGRVVKIKDLETIKTKKGKI